MFNLQNEFFAQYTKRQWKLSIKDFASTVTPRLTFCPTSSSFLNAPDDPTRVLPAHIARSQTMEATVRDKLQHLTSAVL